jgi:hypothetical protein
MKNTIKYAVTALSFILYSAVQAQTYSNHRAVEAYASWDETDLSVTLHWKVEDNAQSYAIYKRVYGSESWGSSLANLTATDSFYQDKDVDASSIYEYAVEKITTITDPFNRPNKLKGYAYITTANKKPAVHTRGVIGLFVMDYIQNSLANEINILTQDLVADGWEIFKEVIASNAGVTDVSGLIDYHVRLEGCNALYLLGNVPVPYSGLYCEDLDYQSPPDGHKTAPNSHCGAWPSDVYYGVIDGAWTDEDSTTLGTREQNKNRIGDGKFDNSRIPGEVTIGVGRVDFSNLPALTKSEIELTRQYLNKVHTYKSGEVKLINQGIVEDNFSTLAEGFGAGAVRDFSAICGKNGVIYDDVFTQTKDRDYALSYTCGAGWYYSCNGFGATISFNTKNAAAFNHLFGSYFGDFDSENNLLRGSLASSKLGFISMWTGRPKWLTHPLALGETYGEITMKSQNNSSNYDAGYYQNGTHMALMGDPSLRHHMILPPKNALLETNTGKDQVTIKWNASSESNVIGYHLYRSQKSSGGYGSPINASLIEGNSYTDNQPYEGTNHYLIKAVKITETGSGSYINMSIGLADSITGIKGSQSNVPIINGSKIKIYPTVVQDKIHVEQKDAQKSPYTIQNSLGMYIMKGEILSQKASIDIQILQSGVYYLMINGSSQKFVKY